MRHVPQQLSFFFKEIIHSIPNRFNCALIAHTWQFCFEARFFFPKALSKHRMGLAPDVVHVSSPEINGMGFAEPALDVDKVCSCWGSCLLCLCQRPATATAKGKDALSRLKTPAHPSWKKQWSWPFVLAQAGAPRLLLHSPATFLDSTHSWGSEILHFLCL